MKKRFKAKIYEASEIELKGTNISCNIIDDVKPPVWFIEFEKRNNARFDRLEADIAIIKTDIKQINARIDNLVIKNNLNE